MSTFRRPPQTSTGIVEDLHAPEVFASTATSFSIADGTVTISFASLRWDNSVSPAVQRPVTVQRVIIPLRGARNLAKELTGLLDKRDAADAAPAGTGTVQ